LTTDRPRLQDGVLLEHITHYVEHPVPVDPPAEPPPPPPMPLPLTKKARRQPRAHTAHEQ